MGRSYEFETALEKIGRILARQYGLRVVYEGNEAKTDGETIYLPAVDDLSPELKQDLNGYLDHEVAHCKFTTFPEISKVKNKFHKNLLNACEDIRIENEMKDEFPGTQFHLNPLRKKCLAETHKNWSEIPWPIKLIVSAQSEMNGEELKIDPDFKEYWDLIEEQRAQLKECKNTTEVREVTEKISEIVKQRAQENGEAQGEEEGEEGSENGKGKGKGEGSSSDSSDGGDSDSDSNSEGEPENGSDGKKSGKGKNPSKELMDKIQKMLSENDGDNKDSDFDKFKTDLGDYINSQINQSIIDDKEQLDEGSRRYRNHEYGMSSKKHTAISTRFDKVTDWTGTGNSKKYMELRSEVLPAIGPVKNSLERVLKVIENARWVGERERGSLNRKDLSKMASYPNYRTPFKDYRKVETNNVAIELLVDMSGSMGGKVRVAKQAVVALAESLRSLQIPFEVTGFQAKGDSRISNLSRTTDGARFNRTNEILDHYVFKSFNSTDLSGIERIFSGHNNVDGESVRWAAKRLSERKEKRKILMVFSDGMPAAHVKDYQVLNGDLKRAVESIKKSGIECIGFGIETDAVSHFYPEFIVIDKLADLPGKVMKKLTQLITRGLRAS